MTPATSVASEPTFSPRRGPSASLSLAASMPRLAASRPAALPGDSKKAAGCAMMDANAARRRRRTKGSPAAVAGIVPDDVILEFDGTPIEDDDHLVSLVSVTPTNRSVTLAVFRNRERISLDMPVASREQFEK
jgi:S1-C subfamily serine protease